MKSGFAALLSLGVLATGAAHAQDNAAESDPGERCKLPGATSVLAFECAGLTVSVGAIYLKRGKTDGVIITPPSPTPGVLVGGENFGFDGSFGPDIYAKLRLNQGWSLEGRYFNTQPDEATYLIPNITTFRIAGIGVTILGGGPVNSIYSSELESAEFNVVKEWKPGISVLAGIRHFGLDENLRVNIATPSIFTNWADANNLTGGQAGIKLGFTAPSLPLQFDATLKGGVYYNSASNIFTSNIVGGASDRSSTTAYAGEIDLTATYHVNERFSVQGGYTSLWLSNVALADAAATTTTQIVGGTSSPVNYTNVRFDAFTLRATYAF